MSPPTSVSSPSEANRSQVDAVGIEHEDGGRVAPQGSSDPRQNGPDQVFDIQAGKRDIGDGLKVPLFFGHALRVRVRFALARDEFGLLPFAAAPLSDVAEDQDDAYDVMALGHDRGRAVVDGNLVTILRDQHRVVGESGDHAVAEHALNGILDWLLGLFVHDDEHVRERAAGRFGRRPTGQRFSDRVEARDAALRIGRDDPIANARERHLQALCRFEHVGRAASPRLVQYR